MDQFDFDQDPARLVIGSGRDVGATDLAKFRARGGKILIWHGLADEQIPAAITQEWYEGLTKAVGGAGATRDFARLFLAPGMNHCGIAELGPGVQVARANSGFDPLPVLEKWVEDGVPPDSILMTKRDKEGRAEWARPICVYPRIARYSGSG